MLSREGVGSEEVIAEHGPQLAAEPVPDGDGEAHFLAREDEVGQVGGEGLSPGWGRDLLKGGAGNDNLIAGHGVDTLLGGRGNDTINATGEDLVDDGMGEDVISIA